MQFLSFEMCCDLQSILQSEINVKHTKHAPNAHIWIHVEWDVGENEFIYLAHFPHASSFSFVFLNKFA